MTYVIVEPCIGEKNASCVDIFHESAVPEEWQSYTQKNRELSGL